MPPFGLHHLPSLPWSSREGLPSAVADNKPMPAQRTDSRAFEVVVDGVVAVVTFDAPGEAVNTLSPEVGAEFDGVLKGLERDEAVRGIVLVSGKLPSVAPIRLP